MNHPYQLSSRKIIPEAQFCRERGKITSGQYNYPLNLPEHTKQIDDAVERKKKKKGKEERTRLLLARGPSYLSTSF